LILWLTVVRTEMSTRNLTESEGWPLCKVDITASCEPVA
jgi:hypothetical protein